MSELTDRAKLFESAIAGFIEARREAKLKDKDKKAEAASQYEYGTWLADAASRAVNLRVVTHPIKFTHSAIKGSTSINYGPAEWKSHSEIGTHSLADPVEDFAITDAKHLGVYSLLNVPVEGEPLLEWVRRSDQDLVCALHDDPDVAYTMLESFRRVFQPEPEITSHTLAKQVYWLHGADPVDDSQYHLLQPMFSSSLEHEINRRIRDARSAWFDARGTTKQKPTHADHHSYPNLVARSLGGSNAQNVSPMNKVRGGVNYLLPSLPPKAWRPSGVKLWRRDSVFEEFFWFGDVRIRTEMLASYLKSVQDSDSTMEIKDTRDELTDKIVDELAPFGATVREQYEVGWTRDSECRLPRCEQLWLDSDRTELPVRSDGAHPQWTRDDLDFNDDYYRGNWADEVAERFGNWLNARLHKAGLVAASLPDRNHWARQVIIDVASPAPMQRRAMGAVT